MPSRARNEIHLWRANRLAIVAGWLHDFQKTDDIVSETDDPAKGWVPLRNW
jgi:hypothetical protein